MNNPTLFFSRMVRIGLVFAVFALPSLYFICDSRIIYSSVRLLNDPNGEAREISLPYSASSAFSKHMVPKGRAKAYRFEVHAIHYPGQRMHWHVNPDGCITGIVMNHEKIAFPPGAPEPCNNQKSFSLDLTRHALPGHNLIEITLSDRDGDQYGLSISPVYPLFTGYAPPNFTLITALWLFALLLHQLKFDRITILIGLLGVSMYWVDFNSISYKLSPDWWGHIPYIKYIAEHWVPPPSYQGWESYHPPLYYYMAAVFCELSEYLGYPYLTGASFIALVSVVLFNLYAMLIFKEAIAINWLRIICITIVMFWPLSHLLSVRISNEVLSYVPWAATYYYLLRWLKDKHSSHYKAALISCGFAMLIKASALIPIGTLGLFTLIALFRGQTKLAYYFRKPILYAGLFLLLCTASTFGRTYYYKTVHAPRMGLIISNIYKDPLYDFLQSEATWQKMLTLDVENLMSSPFVGLLNDEEGRQLFWNSYIKTLAFGFKTFPYGRAAVAINCATALMLLLTLVAPLLLWRVTIIHMYFFLAFVLGISAQMIMRILSMTTATHDGRLTFPVIIMLIGGVAYMSETLLNRKRYIPAAVCIATLGGSLSAVLWYDMLFIRLARLITSLW